MYRSGMKVVWALLALCAACKDERGPREQPPPEAPTPIPTPPPMRDIDEIGPPEPYAEDTWSTTKTCAVQDAELIYVVDSSSRLLSFDPRKLPGDALHVIGRLRCTGGSTPNSMAIDRKGVAWLGYQNGKIYRASIVDAKCDPKGWKPAGDTTRVFGMGFVTKGPRTEEELLFVAGGIDDPQFRFATIDTEQKTWNPIGKVSIRSHPELTGTSEGKLYAYFPTPGRGFVQELDRSNGDAIGPRWKLPDGGGAVDSYAFAHYGGVFYVFTTVEGRSGIHAIHKQTGKVELVDGSIGYEIVGAGVSTCAPLLEAPPAP